MKLLTNHEAFQMLAKALKKPLVVLHFDNYNRVLHYYDELQKAVPYLSFDDHLQAIADGSAVVVCEDAEECERIFDLTVGDDGPTALNKYDGPVRVYAVTIGADGEILNENT